MSKKTIYHKARMEAREYDPLCSSRERAADMLYCSADSLGDYENGYVTPPCHVVQQMVETYRAPWLRAAHIRACCPLHSGHYTEEDERASTLERSALGWAALFEGLRETAIDYAHIARDGQITPEEARRCADIRDKAMEIRAIMQRSIDALDAALLERRAGHENGNDK
ncbi:MAG: hypothetical protein RSE23_01730 [Clostridia bacterium]